MYQCGVQSYCGARIAVEHILCTIAASVNRHSTASIGCRPIEVEYGMYGLSSVAGVFVCTEKSRAVVRDIMLIRIILSLPTDHFRLLYAHKQPTWVYHGQHTCDLQMHAYIQWQGCIFTPIALPTCRQHGDCTGVGSQRRVQQPYIHLSPYHILCRKLLQDRSAGDALILLIIDQIMIAQTDKIIYWCWVEVLHFDYTQFNLQRSLNQNHFVQIPTQQCISIKIHCIHQLKDIQSKILRGQSLPITKKQELSCAGENLLYPNYFKLQNFTYFIFGDCIVI
uniref:Uncharacterized protein n=1 Tax=Spironucleus salmonicida TaxID=348837 RepID=V6LQT0_9EUKA|eukprot:EST46940.1 Hypothetical protein SS50377_13097 [Spironucleus salmonicida]